MLNQLKEVSIKIGENGEEQMNKKRQSRIHALGFALDEGRRKRSPEFFVFFFLVKEQIIPCAGKGVVSGCVCVCVGGGV